jgi:hypothetical protein
LLRTSFAIVLGALAATSAAAQTAAPKKAAAAKTVWADEGPAKWAPRPTETAITANDLRTRLYQFADDSMQGRRIGEIGNYKGTAYIASEFKRLGLKPAGDNGSYFQNMPWGPSAFDSVTSTLSVGGTKLNAKSEWIPVVATAANGIGAKASLSGVATVFGGRWGDTTTLDPALYKGKVVVFIGTPSSAGIVVAGRGGAPTLRCDSVPDKFGAQAAARVEAQLRADSAARVAAGGRGAAAPAAGGRGGAGAAAAGVRDGRIRALDAAAVLIVTLDEVPAATTNAAFNGRSSMQPTVPPSTTAPAGAAISKAAAAQIFGKAIDQVAVGTAGAAVSASWNYEWKMSATPARNVIAILPGSDPALAAEYVLLGAHNDHVGINVNAVDHDSLRASNLIARRQGSNDPVCRPTADQQHKIDSLIARARRIHPIRRDSIMNGADDDGSGTVVLLEVAEKFAKEKPKRSIIFVSHEGEESGLLGSKWFTDHPTIPLAQIAAAVNMDMVGKGRTDQVKYGGPTSVQSLGSRRLSREFGDVIDSVNANRTPVMAVDKTWDVFANPLNRFCRSDQVNYVHHDVPVNYFSTGYAPDYHMQSDEPQYIEYDHMSKIAGFVHDILMAVATNKNRPAIAGADPAYPACR